MSFRVTKLLLGHNMEVERIFPYPKTESKRRNNTSNMEKDYLASLEYGLLALASVGVFTFGIETIKSKLMSYVKKTNCK